MSISNIRATSGTASGGSQPSLISRILHALAPKAVHWQLGGASGWTNYDDPKVTAAIRTGKQTPLPKWLNTHPVEQGGFVGYTADRKSIYQVYGDVYKGGKNQPPPGWFGYNAKGVPVFVSELGSGHNATGQHAIIAEENILAWYPFTDIPPNFAYNYYSPAHGGKPKGAKLILPPGVS
jgi:hypothetical protein